MDVKSEDFKNIQKLLQRELNQYRDSKKEYKPYMQLMDDISNWLKEVSK